MPFQRFAMTCAIAATLLGAGPAHAQAPTSQGQEQGQGPQQDTIQAEPQAASGIGYTVSFSTVPANIKGVPQSAFEAVSILKLEQDRKPGSLFALSQRAGREREQLAKVLRSKGYYDGRVRIDLPATRPADGEVADIKVEVEAGPRTVISDRSRLLWGEFKPPADFPSLASIGIEPGRPAIAEEVQAASRALLEQLVARHHVFAKITASDFVLDRADRSLTVRFTIDPGPFARFGDVSVTGLDRVEEDLVRGRLETRDGEPYDPEQLEKTRDALIDLGVFSRVAMSPQPDKMGPDGQVPLGLTVEERKRRVIEASLGYSTGSGAYLGAGWTHRNLTGWADQFSIAAEVSGAGTGNGGGSGSDATDLGGSIELSYMRPDFLQRDQTLNVDSLAGRDFTDAFTRDQVQAGIGIERPLIENWRGGIGLRARHSKLKFDTDGRPDEVTSRFGIPLELHYDGANDRFRPTSGLRFDADLTPWPVVSGDGEPFVQGSAQLRGYYGLGADDRLVIAARAKVGGSASDGDIPSDSLFYAGGGGSVRGYEFQLAGPLDSDGQPLGGRSMVEGALELRFAVTDEITVVPFVEAGTTYDADLPDFSEDLRLGAGLGLRYHTPVGPLRVDVATPLNPRHADRAVQLYIALGQAF
ncbi:MAG: autotransporter assembly complex family protein [Alphaproteobacteria bacterium]